MTIKTHNGLNHAKATLSFIMMAIVGLALVTAFSLPKAHAKKISVIAVVDGTPISSIDFDERRNFLVKTTGIADTEETREQIDNDVLQMLIDDTIKIAEGLKLGAGFETSAKQRAKELVTLSFSQNGEDPNEVMERLGIDPAVAEKKFLADVLWASSIQSRFARQLSTTREEAKKELARIEKNIQKPHANIDEIILLPEPSRNYTNTLKLANQMYEALLKGADFGRVAQQYSAAGSGRQGGKLGWVLVERLPEALRKITENAPTGAITRPIEIDGAIAIYRINGLRISGQADPLESRVDLVRLVKPFDMTASAEAMNKARRDLTNDVATANSCTDLQTLHQNYGSGSKFELGQFKLIELSPMLQKVILPLDSNEKSDVINFAEGLVVFMVCQKDVPQLVLPSLDQIETSIRNKHFTALSARHISRLRKQAVITYLDQD